VVVQAACSQHAQVLRQVVPDRLHHASCPAWTVCLSTQLPSLSRTPALALTVFWPATVLPCLPLAVFWPATVLHCLHSNSVLACHCPALPHTALMQDQVSALQSTGVPADYLSSTRTAAERRAILDKLTPTAAAVAAAGSSGDRLALLYVTPELIATDRCVHSISNAPHNGSTLNAAGHTALPAWCKHFKHSTGAHKSCEQICSQLKLFKQLMPCIRGR
jgi:hypothetical protein